VEVASESWLTSVSVFEQPQKKAADMTAMAERAFWMFGKRFIRRPFQIMENRVRHVAAGGALVRAAL
jgi:hypothetical protein